MPGIEKQVTVRPHRYGIEVCIRDEYGHWEVIHFNEKERNDLLEKLQANNEP